MSVHRRKRLDRLGVDIVLREQRPLEWSAVQGPWERHQRLELETDLIAATSSSWPAYHRRSSSADRAPRSGVRRPPYTMAETDMRLVGRVCHVV
jgi:hypothetical protein